MGDYIAIQSGIQNWLNNPVKDANPNNANNANVTNKPNNDKLKDALQPNKISKKDQAIINFIRANGSKFPTLVPMLNNPVQRKIATNTIKTFLDPNNTNLLNSLKIQLMKIKEE